MHQRNKNKDKYNLEEMVKTSPELAQYIIITPAKSKSIDFSNPRAVKALNRAILQHYYGIGYWDFPDNNLCPAIPGRAEYIHLVSDLLAKDNAGQVPKGKGIKCLDIGTGAGCVYPIIGVTEYGWSFIGSEVDKASIQSAEKIAVDNPSLVQNIGFRHQTHPNHIFHKIIRNEDLFDITICNPPFHASLEAAQRGTSRKNKNLKTKSPNNKQSNFSGQHHELVFKGGEVGFIKIMIQESKRYAYKVKWFTTLVSKENHMKTIMKALKVVKPATVETLELATGNKKTRILAWSYLNKEDRKY